jgi:hypothetical protein
MTPEKNFRCVSPKSGDHVTHWNDVIDWNDVSRHDQCDVNVTDLKSGKLISVPCTEWEFEDDGRLTLRVRHALLLLLLYILLIT